MDFDQNFIPTKPKRRIIFSFSLTIFLIVAGIVVLTSTTSHYKWTGRRYYSRCIQSCSNRFFRKHNVDKFWELVNDWNKFVISQL